MKFQELTALKKIIRARVELIRRDPFFGGISTRLKPKILTAAQAKFLKTRTMAVDGKHLFYYPPGIHAYDLYQLVTISAHEAAHVGLKHHLRRGKRNFRLWNKATDAVINNILQEAGYNMPENGFYRPDMRGMSAEAVYNELFKEQQAQQQLQQSQQDIGSPSKGGGKSDGDEGQRAKGEGGGFDDGDTQDWDDEDTGDSDVDESEDWEDEFEKNLRSDPEGAYQVTEADLQDMIDEDFEDILNIPPKDQAQGKPNLPDIPELDDDVADGVVLDAPPDFNTVEAEQELDLGIEAAYTSAKNAGMMPGCIEKIIQDEREHKIDYRDLLREWLDKHLYPGDYSWKKPNRRYLNYGHYLPGLAPEEEIPNIVFFCDTSGSVSDWELKTYSREISGVLSEFPAEFDVVYGDTSVRHTQHFETEDLPIKLEIHGGGGTKFVPALKYIRDHYQDIDAILFFTDMGAWDWDEVPQHNPGKPVLWMNTSRYSDDMDVPFGTVVPLEVDYEEYEEESGVPYI